MTFRNWIFSLVIVLGIAGCSGDSASKDVNKGDQDKTKPAPSSAKLEIVDIKSGSGPEAKAGDLVLVTYEGKLKKDGTVFDSNLDLEKAPFPVRIGNGRVIKGWDDGLVGIKKGGVRKLQIPSHLAYGEAGSPPKIGPNEDLEFTITCLDRVGTDEEGVFDKKEIKIGTGKEAINGKVCEVHYTGKLVNGKKFESSKDTGKPFQFTLGAGQVIKGWDAGIVGMKEGGTRELRIPPAIAYGANGSGENIPGEQVLVFTIELLKVSDTPKPPTAPGQGGRR